MYAARPVQHTHVQPAPEQHSSAQPTSTHHAQEMAQQLLENQRLENQTHLQFLAESNQHLAWLSQLNHRQHHIVEATTQEQTVQPVHAAETHPHPYPFEEMQHTLTPPQIDAQNAPMHTSKLVMDRQACLTYARGKIGDVWGERFAFIDHYPTRVRLPDEPLMLVDRVTALEGEPFSLSSGRIVTEHDVRPRAWYLDQDRIPTCVAVESGQADLMLSGHLGIDAITKGLAVYRLLDAQIIFHGPLPRVGETLEHDIRIERFFKHDNTYLFRFAFDTRVQGQTRLSMRQGCAGFFTEAELADGKGVVLTEKEWGFQQQGILPTEPFRWHHPHRKKLERQHICALTAGDLSILYGDQARSLRLQAPATLPGTQHPYMQLLHRIVEIDPQGGRFGIGKIVSEMDIQPEDWFLTCHFIDDQVMPGTLMYECCLHTLRVYLISLGWIGENEQVAWEPVPGIASKLRCRGQVIPSTQNVRYEVHLKEIGFRPEPFAIADTLMFADGRPIVLVQDMSIQLTGSSAHALQALWGSRVPTSPKMLQPITVQERARLPHSITPKSTYEHDALLYTHDQIMEYAIGSPSLCFGPEFQVFDQDRFLARLPNPPYLFMDGVTHLEGTCAQMKEGTRVISFYDVPEQAWYFEDEQSQIMPYAILLEIALQPCGWMAAYMGSALTSDRDLHFRNLGGKAQLHRPVHRHTGRLYVDNTCTQIAQSGDMIIQYYSLSVYDAQGPIYTGTTYFGFFTQSALAEQVGLRNTKPILPQTWEEHAQTFPMPDLYPFAKGNIKMMDQIQVVTQAEHPSYRQHLRGKKYVQAEDWFFKAHFYQDPVWPGSLGLEAFLQLLKVAAAERWGEYAYEAPNT
ncbi:MAG: type I polyketide synthase, partial [Myxococcota bacterium]